MDLTNIRLYRMTHIGNVEHILKNGVTHRTSANSNLEYIPIGDNSLIGTRNNFSVPNGRLLGDYIPFYFGYKTPMLYVIQNGFNGVRATSPEDIVYLVTNLESIRQSGINFFYTDGHAIDVLTRFYVPDDVENITNQVDFEATKAVYWKKDDDLDLKRRKEAELLLENDLPAHYINGIIVYSDSAKQMLINGGVKLTIVVKPNYYF